MRTKVYAPATIANVGPGFDIFGLALNDPRDSVDARITQASPGVNLIYIKNNPGLLLNDTNIVSAVGNKVLAHANENLGIETILEKGMGIGTGLGSSAASSAAAAIAINSLLKKPYDKSSKEMLEACVYGESVAINDDKGHPDNVLPSLLGGFIFVYDSDNSYRRFEVDDSIYFALCSPDLEVKTEEARAALKSSLYNTSKLVSLSRKTLSNYLETNNFIVDHNAIRSVTNEKELFKNVALYLQGSRDVIDGITHNNPELLGRGVLKDKIVTPIRAGFIRGYNQIKHAAMNSDAYGFSIAGSGPTVFAVTDSHDKAWQIGVAMQSEWNHLGVNSKVIVSNVNNKGAININECTLKKDSEKVDEFLMQGYNLLENGKITKGIQLFQSAVIEYGADYRAIKIVLNNAKSKNLLADKFQIHDNARDFLSKATHL